MERSNEAKQENHNTKELIFDSPRKQPSTIRHTTNNTPNDRLKRDEWSEGAVSTLLDAYEAKWVLRNRAKLKGHDWEDVAKHVSSRTNNTKSPKTQTQCKNKIESMKKRYRSESAAAEASLWPLYPRLDLLLRGNGPVAAQTSQGGGAANPQATLLPQESPLPSPPAVAVLQPGSVERNSQGSNGLDRLAKGDDDNIAKLSDHKADKNPINDTDSSTPAICAEKEKSNTMSHLKTNVEKKNKPKRKRGEYWEIGESIRLLAEVIVRSEQARMDTMREIERMRAEAEAKRGEIEIKKMEIIANTQIEIAKIFAKGSIDSSLRIRS